MTGRGPEAGDEAGMSGGGSGPPATGRDPWARATRGRVVLLIVAGALTVLASGLATWVTGTAVDPVGSAGAGTTGTKAAPGVPAAALAAAAGGFALTLADGWGRRVVAAVTAVCGLACAALAIGVVTDPVAAAGEGTASASATLAPWGAVAGAVVVLVGASVSLIAGDRWPRRAPRQATGSHTDRRRSDWDALSEGDDPT